MECSLYWDSRSSDVKKALASVAKDLGPPENWSRWPGGWPGDIESTLVDAVFSARAVYRSRYGRGIHADVVRWRGARSRSEFTLDALLAEIDAAGPPKWAELFGNSQVSPSRPVSAPGGASKAAAVRQAACMLLREGVSADSDITSENVVLVKKALREVQGIGYATTNYFLMLLGRPGVKPDRMIHRFLLKAAGHKFTNLGAEETLTAAAAELGVEPHELEHAIWRFESDGAVGSSLLREQTDHLVS
jgi:hypothetical protein